MLFQLLRVRQWYKNLVIFLPLVFAGLLGDSQSLFFTCIGFLALCLMSSANYILNDMVDAEKDKIHPEKKERPIASRKINTLQASFLAASCAVLSLILGIQLSLSFFYILLFFFLLTQSYSVYFKGEIFLDIILISVNFVLRAMSGAFILNVRLSPWLIVCTFFLSFFIAVGKRKADAVFLQKEAAQHKPVLQGYSPQLTNTLMIIATTALLMSYGLYSFLSIYPHLIYSLPFSLYVILRYYFLIETGSPIARHPEYFSQDKRLSLGILLWLLVIGALIYLL